MVIDTGNKKVRVLNITKKFKFSLKRKSHLLGNKNVRYNNNKRITFSLRNELFIMKLWINKINDSFINLLDKGSFPHDRGAFFPLFGD